MDNETKKRLRITGLGIVIAAILSALIVGRKPAAPDVPAATPASAAVTVPAPPAAPAERSPQRP